MQASYEIEQEKAYLDKVKEEFDKEKEMREIAEKKLKDLSNVSVRVSTVMKEKESLIEQMEEEARNRKVLEKELTEARIGNVQYSDQLTQLKEDMEKLHYQLNTIINERENIKHEIVIERNQFMNEVNVEKERRQRLEEKYSQAEAELQRMHSSVEDIKSNFSLKVENRNRSIFELENVVNEMKMKSIQQNNFIQEHESNVEDLKHKMKCLESEKNSKIDELEKNVKIWK
ncbi:lamin-like protein [Xenia sp. Carnegie-2017]|uniref:lamin-like protein n=1 Tax=Xenia sp. Carnegie-2017 TaxID=2897299 RepID=UPI001F03DADA|nr:lamin-like protein [Xenia sp. Carnegie-2017]